MDQVFKFSLSGRGRDALIKVGQEYADAFFGAPAVIEYVQFEPAFLPLRVDDQGDLVDGGGSTPPELNARFSAVARP